VRHPFAFWGVVLFLPVLHLLLHVGLGLGGWGPDLLTVGLLILAREVRMGTAAGVGFFFGLLEDAFSVLAFGANAFALTVVGAVGARSRDLFVGESLIFLVSYIVVGTWLRFALHWLASGSGLRPEAGQALLVDAPVAALFAAAVGILLLRTTGAWPRERTR
jgi:rod shape-determining protein MreD